MTTEILVEEVGLEDGQILADSVRQFSEALPAVPTVRAYATTAADSLEELAGYVVDSDIADMLADARDFTRRHPLATFGGSIAAGLIITQMVQARAQSMRAGARSSASKPRSRAGKRRRNTAEQEQDDASDGDVS